MPYTPIFQAVLDEIAEKIKVHTPADDIRGFFFKEMVRIGQFERINNLYKIRPKRAIPGERSRYLSFRCNKMQEEFYLKHTNRDSILKMRQGGTTTLSCVIALDKCLFEMGTNAAIMAHVLPNVKKYFRITKNAFMQFQKDWGEYYPVHNTVDNITELHIAETGSILMVCTETKGLTLDFLHISEAAFVEEDRIQESLESVPLSGWVILESTPNGAAGMFYSLWDAYLKSPETSLFTGHFYPWWYIYPEDQDKKWIKLSNNMNFSDKESELIDKYELEDVHIAWRRLKISESSNSEGEFLKKYPEDPITCFLSGDSTVFDIDTMRALWMNSSDPSFRGDLKIAQST